MYPRDVDHDYGERGGEPPVKRLLAFLFVLLMAVPAYAVDLQTGKAIGVIFTAQVVGQTSAQTEFFFTQSAPAGTETNVQVPFGIPSATIVSMTCCRTAAVGTGPTETFTLRKNKSSTGSPTCQITGTGSAGTCCTDTAHPLAFAGGGATPDLIDVQDVTTSTPASGNVSCSLVAQ